MTGGYGRGNKEVSLDGFNSHKQRADSLNEFCLRFDKLDFTEQLDEEEQE